MENRERGPNSEPKHVDGTLQSLLWRRGMTGVLVSMGFGVGSMAVGTIAHRSVVQIGLLVMCGIVGAVSGVALIAAFMRGRHATKRDSRSRER